MEIKQTAAKGRIRNPDAVLNGEEADAGTLQEMMANTPGYRYLAAGRDFEPPGTEEKR